MPYKPKQIEKRYYTIGEVADYFNVASSLIRYWESEFDTIKPQKNKKGNRIYTKDDIEDIRIVYFYVKEKGYTLQGARDMIKLDKHKNLNKIETIKSLESVRNFLIELKNNIEEDE